MDFERRHQSSDLSHVMRSPEISGDGDRGTTPNTEKDQNIDPVCNRVVSSDSQYHYRYVNKDYYFCSGHCLHKFKDHPEQYLDERISPTLEKHGELMIYIGPMHPEIIQNSPGYCPKCGMSLEPKTPMFALEKVEYTCPMHPE